MRDLARLRAFLREKNEAAADKAGLALTAAFQRLGRFPELGRPVEEYLRVLIVPFGKYGYLVAYTIHEERVYILALRSAREKGF